MKRLHITAVLLFLLASVGVKAQQDPFYTLYRYNMNLVNPAFAGSGPSAELGVNIRSQWANVEGAPETQSLVFGIPVGKKVGLGLSVMNDQTFIEKQVFLAADFSYRVKLTETADLIFGLKGGFNSYDANTQGLVTYGVQSDPSLQNLDGRFNLNVGAGALLQGEDYFISLSMPKILTPDRLEQRDGMARLGVEKQHVYVAGGYNITLNPNLILKPTAMLRYVDASPLSVDLTALMEFSQRLELGAGYRYDESISGIFIFKVGQSLDLGYAYEVAFESPVRNIDNGTHEIVMHIAF